MGGLLDFLLLLHELRLGDLQKLFLHLVTDLGNVFSRHIVQPEDYACYDASDEGMAES